jgi:Mrp family chromosome partitioning ATPase
MLDADIYGPSQPMMLGIPGGPSHETARRSSPWRVTASRPARSGFMIDMDTPMVWRGPMVTQALEQLLRETNWRDLDYLIVDMPPGTGDIHLTLSQKIPVTGVVIVTTPAGHRAARRPQGPEDVREGGRADPGHRREHGRVHVCSELRTCRAHLRAGRR